MSCDESSVWKYPWEEMGEAEYTKGDISKISRALNIDADTEIPITTKVHTKIIEFGLKPWIWSEQHKLRVMVVQESAPRSPTWILSLSSSEISRTIPFPLGFLVWDIHFGSWCISLVRICHILFDWWLSNKLVCFNKLQICYLLKKHF